MVRPAQPPPLQARFIGQGVRHHRRVVALMAEPTADARSRHRATRSSFPEAGFHTVTASDVHTNDVVFAGEVVSIGRWRLPAGHPQFGRTGPARGPIMVFPRTTMWIQHDGEAPFVADQNVVTFYNQGQEYRRTVISREGDRCEWFRIEPWVLRDAVRVWDPPAADSERRPFALMHGRSAAESYLAQRCVYRHARQSDRPDRLYIEETMLDVLHATLGRAYRARQHAGVSRTHVDLVMHAREVIATDPTRPLTLADLARRCAVSVFHLARVFRRLTGRSIHCHRNELRLHLSLERVMQRRSDLTAIAIDLGYSSHSHFTAAFKALYGITPSEARARL